MSFRFSRAHIAAFVLVLSFVYSVVMLVSAQAAAPTFSVADAEGNEGDKIIFTITRGGKVDVAATVIVQTVNVSAVAGLDYIAINQTVAFAKDDTKKTVEVETLKDHNVEQDETFTVKLSKPTLGTLTDAEATGTIKNVALTAVPPRNDGAPHAPQTIRVDARQGQPLIQWSDDGRAHWYNLIFLKDLKSVTHNVWYSKPSVQYASVATSLVRCNGISCKLELPPSIYLSGGQYELWMQAWNPGAANTKGIFSKGGTASFGGETFDAFNKFKFTLPTVAPKHPLTSTIAVGNTVTARPTIRWGAADDVLWYQLWIGSQVNGKYTSYHFQNWMPADGLGCVKRNSTCVYMSPPVFSEGYRSRLPIGTYEVWLNSFGPGGFAPSTSNGWKKLTEFIIK